MGPIETISVQGFKALTNPQTVEIRPLTLLAGTNSSGKSSLMQAVLLLKQTLDAPYDPGALLLNGPNVKFTAVEQMLSKVSGATEASPLRLGVELADGQRVELVFQRGTDKRLDVTECSYTCLDGSTMNLRPEMPEEDFLALSPFASEVGKKMLPRGGTVKGKIVRERCFLQPFFELLLPDGRKGGASFRPQNLDITQPLQDIIHLPGLRGNPERSYPRSATGPDFPGTFEKYTASIIAYWSEKHDARLEQLGEELQSLGLTWKVVAKPVDDASVELQVGRLPVSRRGGARDLVNIADVGFGVSQSLPVLVALLAAKPGQLLYIEQPELHLHPRAQVALAQCLVNAAKRGVRVVSETHSSLLLLATQTLIAQEAISPDLVLLHWFRRNDEGITEVIPGTIDPAGRFGNWPVDFDDVTLQAQMDYLNASEQRQSVAHE